LKNQDSNQASPLLPNERHSPFAQAFLDAVHEKIRATGNVPSDEDELLRIASIVQRVIRDHIEFFAYMAYRDLMEQFPEYKIPTMSMSNTGKRWRIHPRIASR
jgi:hypothetical protein